MSHLNPQKLHVDFEQGISQERLTIPRAYTLTHSDMTGDLFLTIARAFNYSQISGWYTRLMRDEVLAQWCDQRDGWCLEVLCHVSGGLAFGPAAWRAAIFRQHLPMVLESFRYGDRKLFEANPVLDEASLWVVFHWKHPQQDQVENWGQFQDYHLSL